jgi:hypothetical protein
MRVLHCAPECGLFGDETGPMFECASTFSQGMLCCGRVQ